MSDFTLSAVSRTDEGKGASRRLRHANGVPAIVYGGKAGANDRKPTSITLKANELTKALESDAFYNSIIDLNIDGKVEQVILQDLQRHPAKAIIWHADFLRVSKTSIVKANVPLRFLNEDNCVGVKVGSGQLTRHLASVEITCTAANLPEVIEVDVANLEVGNSVYLSNLELPKGVELVVFAHGVDTEKDDAVITVSAPRGASANADADEESAEEGDAE